MSVALAAIALCIASVHDGDGVRSCEGERIRIENINAPELPDSPLCRQRRANAWCDYALGYKSRDALARFLKTGRVEMRRNGKDRYGRTLARITVDGRDAGEYLISLGLARPWT